MALKCSIINRHGGTFFANIPQRRLVSVSPNVLIHHKVILLARAILYLVTAINGYTTITRKEYENIICKLRD